MWIKDIYERFKTLKICREKSSLLWIKKYENKNTTTKEKISKLSFIKLKIFISKSIAKKVKRQSKELEKIFVNHIANKNLTSRMYK